MRVLEAYQNGEGSQRELAGRFKVSVDFVRRLLKKYRETGSVRPGRAGGGQRPLVGEEGLAVVALLLANDPRATLATLCERFELETGTNVSVATMCRAKKKLKNVYPPVDSTDSHGDGAAEDVLLAMPESGRTNGQGTFDKEADRQHLSVGS